MSRPFALDPLFLSTKAVPGVGPRFVKLLEKTAGQKVVDLFWMLPAGIIDRRYAPKPVEAQAGAVATIRVTVEAHFPPKREGLPYRVKCRGVDGPGFIDLTFFSARGDYLERQLPIGDTRIVSGRLEFYGGYLQMPHPDYIVEEKDKDQIPAIEAVYPLTAGLTQKVAQKIMRAALSNVPTLPEWNDPALLKREGWPGWRDALLAAHGPKDEDGVSPLCPARRRLAYDELLANQLTIGLVRQQQKKSKGRTLKGDAALSARALAALPFSLTGAQTRAVAEITQDMAQDTRMLRLLQGDVGSGKTAVAFLAAVHAIGSGPEGVKLQAAIMAPTEILARQHEKNIAAFAEKAGLSVTTLTGRDKGKGREAILEKIASGEADIVIGTHALFQDGVEFKDLALVIIDEQHRFGVHQRLQLSGKGTLSDVLVMTATPIPRTLTMTVYGDMDVSRLDEKPAGRQPIDTRVVSCERIGEVMEGLKRKIATGARAYWVCPLVEESEHLDLAAAEERFRVMQDDFGGRCGLLHGRMKPADKDAVMAAFAAGDLDVLVATTVIEVGVDVPQATAMVIEHSERFGLAQLHQLRGRIGRGSEKSACILLYAPNAGEVAQERLKTMRETEDGFLIAEKDLELRGAGEVLGTKQSGLPAFRLANPEFHQDLISIAHDDARVLLNLDPQLLSERGVAIRTLLYLFERDTAIKYLRSG